MNSTADLIRRSVSLPKGSRNSNYTSFPSFKIRSPLVRCILSGVFMHRRDRLVPLRSIEISEVRLCAASRLCRAVLPRGKWNRFCGGVLGSHGHGTGILSVEGTKEKCILGGLSWNEQRFFFLETKNASAEETSQTDSLLFKIAYVCVHRTRYHNSLEFCAQWFRIDGFKPPSFAMRIRLPSSRSSWTPLNTGLT